MALAAALVRFLCRIVEVPNLQRNQMIWGLRDKTMRSGFLRTAGRNLPGPGWFSITKKYFSHLLQLWTYLKISLFQNKWLFLDFFQRTTLGPESFWSRLTFVTVCEYLPSFRMPKNLAVGLILTLLHFVGAVFYQGKAFYYIYLN